MKQVVLFGTNSAVVIAYYQLSASEDYRVVGFTLDSEYITETSMFDLPVVPFDQLETYFPKETHEMFIPIGYSRMNALREKKYLQAKEKGYTLITHTHPSAILSPDVETGENCLIGPYTVIQHGARIGNNVIVRENCHIGHDSVIQDHCFIAGHANISGNVIIEPNCFLGASCVIRDRLILKKRSLIGAGVTMLENSDENGVYMNRSPQKLPFPSDAFKI